MALPGYHAATACVHMHESTTADMIQQHLNLVDWSATNTIPTTAVNPTLCSTQATTEYTAVT